MIHRKQLVYSEVQKCDDLIYLVNQSYKKQSDEQYGCIMSYMQSGGGLCIKLVNKQQQQ